MLHFTCRVLFPSFPPLAFFLPRRAPTSKEWTDQNLHCLLTEPSRHNMCQESRIHQARSEKP